MVRVEEQTASVQVQGLLRVRVVLEDSRPPIWRLVDLLASMPLDRVHCVLQGAFGWEDAHLHRFTDLDPYARPRPVNGEIEWPYNGCPGTS